MQAPDKDPFPYIALILLLLAPFGIIEIFEQLHYLFTHLTWIP